MSTQEVIDSAQALIEEEQNLINRKVEVIAALVSQRVAIDNALEALGEKRTAPTKKPRKAVSETARRNMSAAQRKRFEKGGEQQSTEANT